jgi:hypothetical protein
MTPAAERGDAIVPKCLMFLTFFSDACYGEPRVEGMGR